MRRMAIVSVVLALAVGGAFVAAAGEGSGKWDIAGTEIYTTGLGRWICNYVPLDNQLQHYSYTCDGIWDPTVGYFPIVTQGTYFNGECDRTGPNSFLCNQIGYGGTAAYNVFVIYVTYETRERLPDGTTVSTLGACSYAAWQDPFGDEYPAYGCLYDIPIVSQGKPMQVRTAPRP